MIRESQFIPAWWLPGPHLQTLWPVLCRRQPQIIIRREHLELSDGDFLDLDWSDGEDGPIVVILHGLEGSSTSGYIRGLLATLATRGWRAVVMHFRGCSGTPNRLARSYNAGDTGDLATVITTLRQRDPTTSIACVGYSLGGNVLLKWLGETGKVAPLQAAVAVAVPFLLDTAARRMKHGFSRLYQAYLLNRLRTSYRRKFSHWRAPPFPLEKLSQLTDFYAFDDQITAPLHGYSGVHDYYARASCRPYLKDIAIPTLILHARDDPFMLPDAIPDATELSESVILELSRHGGHVGFVSGPTPWQPTYWLEQRIPAFLEKQLG